MRQPTVYSSRSRTTLVGGEPGAYAYIETRWRFPGPVWIERIPVGASSPTETATR